MSNIHEIYDAAEKLKDAGKLEEAVAKLLEALEIDSGFALAHSALAVHYGKLDEHEKAIQHGLEVIELEPDDAFSYTAMSVTYQRSGKVPEADDMMTRSHSVQQGSK